MSKQFVYEKQTGETYGIYNIDENPKRMFARSIPDKETAKLFAAAPQLLEALELVKDDACNCHSVHSWYGEGHAVQCPCGIAEKAIKAATE